MPTKLFRQKCKNVSQVSLSRWLVVCVVLWIGGLSTATTIGQEKKWESVDIPQKYLQEEIPEDADRETRAAMRTTNRAAKDLVNNSRKSIRAFLEGDGANPGNTKQFFDEYIFAQMTQTDLPTLSSLGNLRADFFKDYLNDRVSGTARNSLIDQITLPAMRAYADNEAFHPAVRHNAVVMISMLDSDAGDYPSVLPTQSTAALQFLSTVFTDAKYPDYLKAAALSGLQRSVEIGAVKGSVPNRAALTNQMLAVVEDRAAGQQGWSSELQYWMKRRSIQCLGLMKGAGNGGQVIDALRKVIKDGKRGELWARFDAVKALSEIDLGSVAAAKSKGLTTDVAEFVADSLNAEGEELLASLDELIYKNIIFDDRDLAIQDNNVNRSGRGADNLNMGGGGSAGMGGPDEQGGGTGGSGRKKDEEKSPTVEVANYRKNIARRRAKIICHFVAQFYADQSNMSQVAATNQEDGFLEAFRAKLNSVVEGSEIGVLDATSEKVIGSPANGEGYTEHLANYLITSSKEIRKLLPKPEGQAKPEEGLGG